MDEDVVRLEILRLAEIADRLARRDFRQQRVIRDKSRAFELNDRQFRRFFRIDKDIVLGLCRRLDDRLSGNHILAIPADTKILVALRFLAVGSYQLAVGQDLFLAVSQPTVSRCVASVTQAIIDLIMPDFIKFPMTEEHEMRVKMRFNEKTGFPGTIGAVDGTHIAIVAPPQRDERFPEHMFVNRKGFHSLNVQIICDYDLQILNVNAKFPGSTHDSHIFRMSNVSTHLERMYANGRRNYWLIGDSGYPLRPWLMTPILNAAQNSPEERFSKTLCKARCSVERCIGVLNQAIRCLLQHRTLHYAPTKAAKIIYACCTLHNIRRARRLEVGDDSDDEDYDEDEIFEDEIVADNYIPRANDNWLRPGQEQRAQIVRLFRRQYEY